MDVGISGDASSNSVRRMRCAIQSVRTIWLQFRKNPVRNGAICLETEYEKIRSKVYDRFEQLGNAAVENLSCRIAAKFLIILQGQNFNIVNEQRNLKHMARGVAVEEMVEDLQSVQVQRPYVYAALK